jgi:hypothetical protein
LNVSNITCSPKSSRLPSESATNRYLTSISTSSARSIRNQPQSKPFESITKFWSLEGASWHHASDAGEQTKARKTKKISSILPNVRLAIKTPKKKKINNNCNEPFTTKWNNSSHLRVLE